ncbi:MAG: polymer-forming cytoskeletal protein [Candidatus Acidiferrales bacterium]
MNPGMRDSSYGLPEQKPPSASGSAPSSAPQASYAPVVSPNAAILTRGICIKGELTGKADLIIDGDVKGSIRLGDSRLTIGQSGHIQADIEASEIIVRGQVEGDLRGRERVVLGSSCEVVGDLEAPRVAIEDGARFNGRVEMGPAADARERQNKRGSQSLVSSEASSLEPEASLPVALETQRR